MTQNDLDMFKIKSIHMHTTHTQGAILLSVSLYDEPFSSHAPFFRKVHWMTPNDIDMTVNRFWVVSIFRKGAPQMTQMTLTCSRSKSTNMHVTYTPEVQIFVRFALRWAVFELQSYFWKSAPNHPKMTLTCSRSKIPTYMLPTPPRPKFSSVLLYDETFLSYGPIFGTVHQMTPNDLDMVKVKNTNMHAT